MLRSLPVQSNGALRFSYHQRSLPKMHGLWQDGILKPNDRWILTSACVVVCARMHDTRASRVYTRNNAQRTKTLMLVSELHARSRA